MKEKWMVYTKRADFYALAEELRVSPVLVRIMRNRGITDAAEMARYLYGTLDSLHDPFLMKDMEKAVTLIRKGIAERQRFRVISDYDIDGICSAYIMTNGLREAGADADLVIPNRITDGYGVNERLILDAYEKGIDTIITCDNGIAAFDAVKLAKEKGMTVIVTDHHGVPYQETDGCRTYILPPADAVINPKQTDCGYPFKELCGASIAWKLITALFRKAGLDGGEEEKYLIFAGIATIGDVVDLTGENRLIAKYGLKAFSDTDNKGLKALAAVCNLERSQISSYHIGFILGPCLNASGRLDTARKAVAMLNAASEKEAYELAAELKNLNEKRKEMTERQVILAKQQAEQYREDRVLVLYLPDCHESIAGIVAGRVREAYYKPTLVFTDAEDGIKGSGRSIEGYHMFEKLSECRAYFTKFGGHRMAAGFSARKENLHDIRQFLNTNCGLSEDDLQPKIWIDAEMPFSCATEPFTEELRMLEPFGKGNEKPVFAQRNVSVMSYRVLGKNKNVIKLELMGEDFCRISGVCFLPCDEWENYLTDRFGKEEKERARYGMKNQIRLSVLYYPVWDAYSQSVQIRIQKFQ